MGFPMRCDESPGFILKQSLSFNPLWVFQCAATIYPICLRCANITVSIPYGFSNALRRIIDIVPDNLDRVSIPYGFSNALRRDCFGCYEQEVKMFQSLMGFPMRCDLISQPVGCKRFLSFNPLWVFQCAATRII